VMVNWTEADAICKKQGRRLPTEAEWEYAARGGVSTCEYGTSQCAEATQSNACMSCNDQSCALTKSCIVMKFSANAFGLYDMSGSVWEWVEDDYHGSYTGAPTNGSAWVDNPRGGSRVLRGGSWDDGNPDTLRAAGRYGGGPGLRGNAVGFRCVASSEDSN